jgi:cytoskeleton protein RodZ
MGDFGGKLRQARERRGVSLRQISAATKISVGVLEALERNDLSKLPGGIFSRAFVRSYATEVGLNPDETIHEFLAEFPGEADTTALHPPSPASAAAAHMPRVAPAPRRALPVVEIAPDESEFESQQRMARVVLRLLMVSVPIVLVILYFSLRGGAPPPAPGIEAAPPSSSVPEPPPPAPTGAATAGRQPAAPATAAAPSPAPAVAADQQMIELRPSGPCWVSLRIDGAPSFEREMQGGERVIRTFREEAVLRVGDGAACEFALNGRVARLLGGPGVPRTIKITPENLTSYLP